MSVDKDLLKTLIVEYGRLLAKENYTWSLSICSNPFEDLVFIALTSTGMGDVFAFRDYFTLKFLARNSKKKLSEYILNNVEKLCQELKIEKRVVKETLVGLARLSQKYRLEEVSWRDMGVALKNVDANKFVEDLAKIYKFRAKEGEILPFAISQLCRVWGLQPPKDLELSRNTKEVLRKLGLSENDFKKQDYPT